MTIANGSAIDGAELYTALNARVADLASDSFRPLYWHLVLDFESFGSGTPLALREQRFTMPDDMRLRAESRVSLEPGVTGDFTFRLTGPLTNPVSASITAAGTGVVTTTLNIADPGGTAFSSFLMLLKGATYTATVTSSISSLRTMRPVLLFEGFARR
jgi:hypothetical protein